MKDPKLAEVRVRDLFPGCWIDGNGDAHFSIPEIHAIFGLPDTTEDRVETMQMLSSILKAQLPDAELIERMDPPAPDPINRLN
jgi:hypothetical protein